MKNFYFAYGSNMKTKRLVERVRSAEPLGAAYLADHRFLMNKLGRDGSAKANIVKAVGSRVWGVLFRLDPKEWETLDRIEGGYVRIATRVMIEDGVLREVCTYQCVHAEHITDDAVSHHWYHQLILEGAREHRLPEAYRGLLERLAVRRSQVLA